MNALRILMLLVCMGARAGAAPAWEDALRAMPLPSEGPLLNRDNAVSVLLHAFRSNSIVKGLLVLPEVADDFYLINRDAPLLNLRATNVLEAIRALTNRTALRVRWIEPFVLVHLPADRLQPDLKAADAGTAQRLRQEIALSKVLLIDRHWEKLQPELGAALKLPVQPAAASADAWHFARHNIAGWNLTGWELLSAVALAGNTTVTIQKQAIQFQERVKP